MRREKSGAASRGLYGQKEIARAVSSHQVRRRFRYAIAFDVS
jgi:hypothetical protein